MTTPRTTPSGDAGVRTSVPAAASPYLFLRPADVASFEDAARRAATPEAIRELVSRAAALGRRGMGHVISFHDEERLLARLGALVPAWTPALLHAVRPPVRGRAHPRRRGAGPGGAPLRLARRYEFVALALRSSVCAGQDALIERALEDEAWRREWLTFLMPAAPALRPETQWRLVQAAVDRIQDQGAGPLTAALDHVSPAAFAAAPRAALRRALRRILEGDDTVRPLALRMLAVAPGDALDPAVAPRRRAVSSPRRAE